MIRHIPPANSPRPRVEDFLLNQSGDEEHEDEGVGGVQRWWRRSDKTGRRGDEGGDEEEDDAGGFGWLERYAAWHARVMSSSEERSKAKYLVSRHFPTSGNPKHPLFRP